MSACLCFLHHSTHAMCCHPTLSDQVNQKADHPTFEDTAAIPTFFDNRGKTALHAPILKTDPLPMNVKRDPKSSPARSCTPETKKKTRSDKRQNKGNKNESPTVITTTRLLPFLTI
ncbi:hypothetical protein QR685DRAFT_112606 [Neurospora intermedia]|uniref:Secreted protein n=1 Tax=Neurospora intermedia TaxID=5142 RepID=A0ABR3D257_NEUIN